MHRREPFDTMTLKPSPRTMTNVRRPSRTWRDLGCSPRSLCLTLGDALREDRGLHAAVRVDVQAITMLVERHKLGPFLGRQVEKSLMPSLPVAIENQIAASVSRQAEVAAGCLAGFAGIADRFEKAGVPLVMLKGAALGERLFGGVTNRGYWDLDILVHEHAQALAGRLLEEEGFRRTASVLFSERLSALFSHGFDYERHDLKVDLHWCLSRVPGFRVDSSAMLRRAVMFNVGGRETPILALEDELVFELVSMFADIQRGGLRLQSFVDLLAMLRQLPGIVWEDFFARRHAEGCQAACRGVLGIFLSILALETVFPELAAVVGDLPSFDESLVVLASGGAAGRARRWAASRMPVSPLTYAAWWAVSLPFRVAASHPSLKRYGPARAPR